jgi:hypothetical protein
VAFTDGQLRLASKGRGWAEGFEIGVPGADRPTLRVERMDLVGIDVDWPHHARVARAGFRRPRAEVVREADGSFDVQRLFVAPGTRPTRRAASPRGERPKDLLDTIRLDFKEIRVEDGFVRFLDRTTTPAFSKDFSQLSVAVDRLGNRPGRRAGLAVESVVGGDSTLQAQGELGAIGSPVFVDVTGEVRHLSLASFNPYAEARLGWVIKQGELEHTVRFTLDGSALEADNDIVVGQLRVAPSRGADEVRKQIGLPLGLIVALAKDRQGEIRASIPVSGSINDPAFNFRGLMWTAVRQSVARIVRAPFRTISRSPSRSSSGGEAVAEPTVDPVTFAAGSAVIGPDMEQHLLRVADFLRRSPFVNLVLTSEPGADDVQALTPTAALVDLERRRLDATRERLVSVEGIPAGRLEIGVTRPAGASGSADTAGRVELAVIAGSD